LGHVERWRETFPAVWLLSTTVVTDVTQLRRSQTFRILSMKLSPVRSTPPWLKSITPSHFDTVREILSEREAKRDCARFASKFPPNLSNDQSKATHNLFDLQKLNDSPSCQLSYSVTVAALPENRRHNRYMDIAPYDRTRVVVNHERSEESTRQDKGGYLNASWVLERFGHKWWIATQAPLPVTAHTFLSLFLQPISCPPRSLYAPSSRMSRLRTVVQLTQNYESGRRKADAYFPSDVGKSLIVSPDGGGSTSALKVTLLSEQSIEEANCVQSTICITPITLSRSQVRPRGYDRFDKLSDDKDEDDYREEGEQDEAVIIQHMLYTAWPDHGVPEPEVRAGLHTFLQLVDSTNRDVSLASRTGDGDLDPDPPIVVGCSAGIGRTGSFIALSSLLRSCGSLPPPAFPTPSSALPRSPLGALPHAIKDDLVAQEIDSLREQRPRMVERDEQMLLIYEIMGAAFASD